MDRSAEAPLIKSQAAAPAGQTAPPSTALPSAPVDLPPPAQLPPKPVPIYPPPNRPMAVPHFGTAAPKPNIIPSGPLKPLPAPPPVDKPRAPMRKPGYTHYYDPRTDDNTDFLYDPTP